MFLRSRYLATAVSLAPQFVLWASRPQYYPVVVGFLRRMSVFRLYNIKWQDEWRMMNCKGFRMGCCYLTKFYPCIWKDWFMSWKIGVPSETRTQYLQNTSPQPCSRPNWLVYSLSWPNKGPWLGRHVANPSCNERCKKYLEETSAIREAVIKI
jgi:hypothetical protein